MGTDGHRAVYPETYFCERGRHYQRACADAKVRTREYRTGSSHPMSSPITSSPVTPSGQYQTQTRRPSTSSRPSTRDGKILKPEIIIQIGSKKGKGKDYPTVSISTKDRSSTGSTSVVDSPGSDTVRTGYPETHVPFHSDYGRGSGLSPRPDQYRNPSSDESLRGSGRAQFQFRTSDEYDTPSLATSTSATTATSSGTRPVIHHGQRHVPSPIDTTRGQSNAPCSPYRTTVITPRGIVDEIAERPTHRNTTSYAPEITGRDEDRQRRRDEQRRRQEATDQEVAANLMREENNKRVRFEKSRAQERAEQRAEKTFSGRADGRERLRQQERQEQDARLAKETSAKEAAARKAAVKEPAAGRTKASANPTKSSAPARRQSVRMTAAEAAKQKQLIDADALQMREERAKAEAMEREEQSQQVPQFPLQQLQQDPRYFDPRGGRSTMPNGPAPVPRRPSLSSTQRPDLSRSGSMRGTGLPQARSDRRQPPLSFPANFNAQADLPQPRERRPSSSHGNAGPWDTRNMRDALPSARGPQVGHNLPRQASHRLNQAFYHGDYETDSGDEYRK